ncbi:carotenoid oxygenase family protein, partial [Burkholderia gladioli]|nr:carotenoid oxygenase family protein [Burkholderia gladioli]
LIPEASDSHLHLRIAPAVARATIEDGVATRPITDFAAYTDQLQQFVYRSGAFMKPLFAAATVFVPRAGSSEDDDGWVLACVYRAATDTSDVVVLDARRLDAEPVATVHLPVRIPAGFHGAWLPRD